MLRGSRPVGHGEDDTQPEITVLDRPGACSLLDAGPGGPCRAGPAPRPEPGRPGPPGGGRGEVGPGGPVLESLPDLCPPGLRGPGPLWAGAGTAGPFPPDAQPCPGDPPGGAGSGP